MTTTYYDDRIEIEPYRRWNPASRGWVDAGFYGIVRHSRLGTIRGVVRPTEESARVALDKKIATIEARLDEDRDIKERWLGEARRVSGWARDRFPAGSPPEHLNEGDLVWLWAHGKARMGVVGSVSKTGKRARVVYVTPSNGTIHVSTFSASDLLRKAL